MLLLGTELVRNNLVMLVEMNVSVCVTISPTSTCPQEQEMLCPALVLHLSAQH